MPAAVSLGALHGVPDADTRRHNIGSRSGSLEGGTLLATGSVSLNASSMSNSASPPERQCHWLQRSQRHLPRWALWLLLSAIILGVGLRLYQFTAGASLWLDELAIANGLAERSLWSLLSEPLAYAQVAPAGFILVEKLMYDLFGANDLTLRLYSLIMGIGALGAIALIALRLGMRETAWVAPLLLAIGGPFVFQSAQVKPYSGDVFLSLMLVAAALPLGTQSNARRRGAVALGVVAPWFSFAAALTMAGIGAVLLASRQRRRLLLVVALWGLSAGAVLLIASGLVDSETSANMQRFWGRNALGFPNGISDLFTWISGQLRAHLWSDIGLRGVTYWLGIAAIGAMMLWRRSRFALGVVVAPILAAVLAALLHRYPLGARLSHWIAALLIVLIVAAAEELVRLLKRVRLARLAPVPGMAVAALPLMTFSQSPPPYRVDHVKPILAAVARARRPDDWLYVYPGAWHAYRYYGSLTGIAPERVVYGRCPLTSFSEALASLDVLRGGTRVWILIAHVMQPRERALVLSYLDRIGVREQGFLYPGPYANDSRSVEAHLYDLSDPVRLRSVTWSTYQIALSAIPNDQTVCTSDMGSPRVGARARVTSTGEVEHE